MELKGNYPGYSLTNPKSRCSPACQTGFTLVEIMVGLAIGMLATLVILQVMSAFETQKRTTTGNADAQTNGGIALYTIQRDLQMAGYPLLPVTNSPLECTTLTVDGVADTTIPNRLSPVAITDGGTAAGASDTITLRYGNSNLGGVPTQINVLPIASAATAAPAMDVTVAGSVGCLPGDKMLIVTGTACTMSNIVAVPNTTTITFVNPAPPLTANATATAVTTAAAAVLSNLACLGTWNEITYRASGGNMDRRNLAVSTTFDTSVTGIVNIQAQYGISATGLVNTDPRFNQITQWVDATAAAGWNAPAVVDRNRIKALRVAVVARNPKREPATVTSTCTTAKGTVNKGPCAWDDSNVDAAPKIDLSIDADWAHYRYRVFETIIPLRNMIWSKSTL